MNKGAYISAHHIPPRASASAIGTVSPIASYLKLGTIASNVDPGRVLVTGAFTAAVGMLIIIFSCGAVISFLIGRTFNWISNIPRSERVSQLTKIVSVQKRTTVPRSRSLMTPIGALVSPVDWIVAQRYRSSSHFIHWIIANVSSPPIFVLSQRTS